MPQPQLEHVGLIHPLVSKIISVSIDEIKSDIVIKNGWIDVVVRASHDVSE
jgi:hypothetical protein